MGRSTPEGLLLEHEGTRWTCHQHVAAVSLSGTSRVKGDRRRPKRPSTRSVSPFSSLAARGCNTQAAAGYTNLQWGGVSTWGTLTAEWYSLGVSPQRRSHHLHWGIADARARKKGDRNRPKRTSTRSVVFSPENTPSSSIEPSSRPRGPLSGKVSVMSSRGDVGAEGKP